MRGFLIAVDRFNSAIGKAFGWCIVALTLVATYDIVAGSPLIKDPTLWAFDASYQLYGALFMMAGAYTLARNGHVRGDFMYRLWRPRRQAAVDLVLYLIFFFPGILALIYAGTDYALRSWSYGTDGWGERAASSPIGVPIAPFKTLIPVTGVLMLLQGIVETIRCVICLRTGEWPQRLSDVEELEKLILERAEKEKAGEAGR
jgi:TRAP-type mannitol/chloroaromatic compound transport system permease small subunit